MRCSDEDRELVAQVLNNAYADGRLDFEEHSERITLAYNAKTFGDLDPLTLDLIPGQPGPPVHHAPPQLGPQTRPQPLVQPAVNLPDGIGTFSKGRAILSTFKPGAPLTMPPVSEVTAVMGEVRLDLVGATFASPHIVINISAVLSNVRIRVPEGIRVINNMGNVLGDSKVEGLVLRQEQASVTLEGTSFLSEVRVLGPDTRRGKFERFVR